ncbi:hypothetical protein B0H11DRAFT_2124557 [Mycena galericulata]|nr:hypothetical protein B0H11DRAFT_2124557 [Mycena galericulata]
MALNLTNQVRSISLVTKAETIDVDVSGEMLDLKVTNNEMVARLGNFSSEATRVALEVGTYGKLGRQARVEAREESHRQQSVAKGDLTRKIAGLSVSGEKLSLANTINDMIDH